MASEVISQDPSHIVLDPHEPLPVEFHPNLDHIVTEDDTPVDNIYAEKQQRLLPHILYSSWKGPGGKRRFEAMSNVGLFSAVGEPPFVPDVLVSLDVQLPASLWPKGHRSYFIWYYGKPPDLVIEVVSNSEGREDTEKLHGYARIGIPYYVIFDPEQILSDTVLRGYRRNGLTYQPLELPLWFPELELGLCLWTGPFEGREESWLRWTDRAGKLLSTGQELADQAREQAIQAREQAIQEREQAIQAREQANQAREQADQERDRANQERDRANQERDRADWERDRASRLADQLRRLGIEPDEIH
jgi:hypothetical protein